MHSSESAGKIVLVSNPVKYVIKGSEYTFVADGGIDVSFDPIPAKLPV